MSRVSVPDGTQNHVLLLSRRRCCLCFGLNGDLGQKRGQIAHLDYDNTNNDSDNLAFVCLSHHDEYDSRTSQSKGLRKDEVKKYREQLYAKVSSLPIQTDAEVATPSEFPSNLQADFDGALLGSIYLVPEGVWSRSYSPSAVEWKGMRMVVTNQVVKGQKVGSAKGVSVRVQFEHDTGLDAGCASPTAWLHEKRGYVDFNPGDVKEAIIAVRSETEWYTVTNVRDASGYPPNRSAMSFHSAPWSAGKLHVGLITNGEVIERHFSWETPMIQQGNGILKAGFPKIRPLRS